MKKLFLLFISLILVLSQLNIVVASDQQQPVFLEVTQDDVRVRTGPSTSYPILQINGENQYYFEKTNYEIITSQTNEKDELWYQVKNIINDIEYQTWVRSDFVLLHYYEYDEEFENYLTEQGFDDSYKEYLRYLHNIHPNWVFVAYHTNIEFEDILDGQCVLGRSLIDGSNLALRSTEPGAYDPVTGQFLPLDGYNWFQANRETIAYYLDPRNFIREEEIFQFVKLSFTEIETAEMVQSVLNGTFMENDAILSENESKPYKQIFYEAGQNANVSPLYLATLARQEQGVNGSAATDGREFEYEGKTYKGIYNFFNIHAYSGADNWKYGLVYAATEGSYLRPWDNIEKSIKGGALWIADGYINDGQDTAYYQKFNCVTKQYWHQYMTNIRAAYFDSFTLYSAYKTGNCLDDAITFCIPIYLNMPEKTQLPTEIHYPSVDDDNEDYFTGDLIEDLGLVSENGFLKGFELNQTYQNLKEKIELMGPNVKIKIENSDGEIADQDLLKTGMKITITDTKGDSFYTIIIKGDINGDGKIDTTDYLLYRKYLLELYDFDEIKYEAAKINGIEEVNTTGYLYMRKYLLEIGDIEKW